MHQRLKSLILIIFCALACPNHSSGQANGFLISEGSSITMRSISRMENGNIVVRVMPFIFSTAWDAVYLCDSLGNQLHKFEDRSVFIMKSYVQNNKLVIYCVDTPWSENISRIIVLDSAFNIIKNSIPIRVNWPEQYFYTRDNQYFLYGNMIRYFGLFRSTNDPTANTFNSWVLLSPTYDTLTASHLRFEPNTKVGIGMYQRDSFYYFTGDRELVTFPWSTTIAVSVIHQFNDSLQWIRTRNLSGPSIVPGYPRLLESTQLRNLMINEHSVYGFAEHRAASPNLFSDIAYSFALYQFDRNLNFKKVVHQLANPGRRAETGSFSSETITFDQSKKYIYAVGSHCEPQPLNFNNQNRTCAYTILKYDTALNLIWRQEIEMPKTFLQAQTLTPTPDGGVLVAGMRIDSTPNPNFTNIFVVKLDSTGRHSVSVSEMPKANQVKAYPNPVDDLLLMQWDHGHFNRIEIYNSQGQKCGSWKTESDSNLIELQLGHLPAGLYHYRLLGNGQVQTGKFVKK